MPGSANCWRSNSSVQFHKEINLSSKKVLLAFGDSLTEGYTHYGLKFHPYAWNLAALMEGADKQVMIDQRGISGETTGRMVPRLKDLLASNKYNYVVILGGTNDVGQRDAQPIFNNLKIMLELATLQNVTPYAVTIPELMHEGLGSMPQLKETRTKVNTLLREYCTNFQIKLIDLETKIPYFSLSQSKQKELWDDGVHFTAKGYDLFGEIIFEAIKDDL